MVCPLPVNVEDCGHGSGMVHCCAFAERGDHLPAGKSPMVRPRQAWHALRVALKSPVQRAASHKATACTATGSPFPQALAAWQTGWSAPRQHVECALCSASLTSGCIGEAVAFAPHLLCVAAQPCRWVLARDGVRAATCAITGQPGAQPHTASSCTADPAVCRRGRAGGGLALPAARAARPPRSAAVHAVRLRQARRRGGRGLGVLRGGARLLRQPVCVTRFRPAARS